MRNSTHRRPFYSRFTSSGLGRLGLTALLFFGVSTSTAAQTTTNRGTASALFGSYSLVGGEKDGQKLPDERVAGSTVRIADTVITTFDKDKKETYAATYTLDTSREPWRITMTSTIAPVKGEVAEGLIQKEGDTVRLIYAVRGGAAPNDFTTENNQLLFVMKQAGSKTSANMQ